MSFPSRWEVHAANPVSYNLAITPRLFAPGNTALAGYGRVGGRRFVVVDTEVLARHGDAIRAWFAGGGIEARIVPLTAGEEHKSLATWQRLACELDAFPLHRRDEPIIAIGGGVLTDVVGYLAAGYRRGLPHIKVPTTLMGQIDAALGIKAGINFNGHKNRLGCFEPPQAVLIDPGFLTTLPRRHLVNGICEIVKLALACDATLFQQLEADGATAIATAFQLDAGGAILGRAITSMLAELAPNLHERELSRRVDFGHTFSYGLELRHPQRLLHGEAVLLDVLVSTLIARQRQWLTEAETTRVFALLMHLGIQPDIETLDGPAMWAALEDRIEHRNGQQRVPLPHGIGRSVFANDITRGELATALHALSARFGNHHEPAHER